MNLQEELARQGVEVARRDYDTHLELAADFGPSQSISVDVVGETAIVVTDEETYEFDVQESAQAFIKNGILTIEVNEETQS